MNHTGIMLEAVLQCCFDAARRHRVDSDHSVFSFFPPSHASPWQQKAICAAASCHGAVTSDPRLLLMLGLAGRLEVSPAEPHIPRASTPVVRIALWEFTARKHRRSSDVQLETKSEKYNK